MKKEPDTKEKSKVWSLGSCWAVKQAQCSDITTEIQQDTYKY